MNLWQRLWVDEAGAVLSAEAVLIGTVGILGAAVGLTAVRNSVNDELAETACAIRSLDQSYCIPAAASGCGAWTAGSQYTQPPVDESTAELSAQIEALQQGAAAPQPAPSEEDSSRRD